MSNQICNRKETETGQPPGPGKLAGADAIEEHVGPTEWSRPNTHRPDAPPGLGTFRWRRTASDHTLCTVIYVTPQGNEIQTGAHLHVPFNVRGSYKPPPGALPPLPKASPRRCGCHAGPHTCSACGQPYFVEHHGYGDGQCSYCYYRG